MKRQIFGLCVAALIVGGCNNASSSDATSAKSSAGKNGASLTATATDGSKSTVSLAGKWKGKLELPKSTADDPGAKMAEAFGDMFMSMISLEFTETEYTLSLMGIPIKGGYEVDGSSITLTPKTVMGMPPEEFAKSMKDSKSDPSQPSPDPNEISKPMKATLSPDGASLRIAPEEGKESEGTLLFERAPEEKPKEVSKPTVKGIEAELVGRYVGDPNSINEAALPPEQKAEIAMMKSVVGSASLVLSADNTFKLNLMFDIEGTWLATGGKLTLTPTKLESSSPTGGKVTTSSEIMDFRVEEGGKRLVLFEVAGKPAFSLMRAD